MSAVAPPTGVNRKRRETEHSTLVARLRKSKAIYPQPACLNSVYTDYVLFVAHLTMLLVGEYYSI
jgi:hypothetical protein